MVLSIWHQYDEDNKRRNTVDVYNTFNVKIKIIQTEFSIATLNNSIPSPNCYQNKIDKRMQELEVLCKAN